MLAEEKNANIRILNSYSNIRMKCEYSNIRIFIDIPTFFNANEGVGLKNGVPYLQMGLPTLATQVSRRPEEK